MKFGTSRGLERERPLINLVSMIDATFLLLSFFLVTSGSAMLEGRLTGALGTSRGASGDLQAVVVEMLGTNQATWYRMAGRRIDGDAALAAMLQPMNKEPGIALRIHEGPSVADAAQLMQIVRDAGFQRVSYAPAP